MKLLIVGDIHLSKYSSIVRSRGKNFSTRLEHIIKSISWAEQVAKEHDCVEEIFLGDTFDRPDLDREEITSLSEIEWNKSSRLKHFIVGNHESGESSLQYSSTQALHKIGVIEDTPYLYHLDDATDLLFLPYITEDDRQPLSSYLEGRDKNKKLIVFSHNDIKDFRMGPFLSTTGFKIDEILENCDLYINGHLHNGDWVVKDKILNLGVLCGQNFNEDSFKYEHHVAILDTDTLQIEFIENPYAFNFYKLEINTEEDIKQLYRLKPNAVLSIKCLDKLEERARDVIKTLNDIIEYRFILYSEEFNASDYAVAKTLGINSADHLEQFKKFILEKYGNTNTIIEELNEVCK